MKRLAASFVLACRANDLGDGCGADAASACAQSYREHMIEVRRDASAGRVVGEPRRRTSGDDPG